MPTTIERNEVAAVTNGTNLTIEGLLEMLLRISTNHNETLVSDEAE